MTLRSEASWQALVQQSIDIAKSKDRLRCQINLMFDHIQNLEDRLCLNGLAVPPREFMTEVNKRFPLEK